MCGEKLMVIYTAPRAGGSPPRVRGKVQVCSMKVCQKLITPACAGKSCYLGGGCLGNKDHPRVCGEKSTARGSVKYILGSPPRVRGKADVRRRGAYTSRITPACAGKRHSDCTGNSAHRDHPRVCGEKKMWILIKGGTLGSPPRVRGKGNLHL